MKLLLFSDRLLEENFSVEFIIASKFALFKYIEMEKQYHNVFKSLEKININKIIIDSLQPISEEGLNKRKADIENKKSNNKINEKMTIEELKKIKE